MNGMIEIRFHGRGGQGAVTAARLLAEAAFAEGKHSQALPFFGAERRGAPVLAFTRIEGGKHTKVTMEGCSSSEGVRVTSELQRSLA